ncbi:MAG: hypothetical protein CL557_12585 [Alphaproteobacteria bacterium]|nr:hypothetical protein [Alphaproteobacteria bacterium]
MRLEKKQPNLKHYHLSLKSYRYSLIDLVIKPLFLLLLLLHPYLHWQHLLLLKTYKDSNLTIQPQSKMYFQRFLLLKLLD